MTSHEARPIRPDPLRSVEALLLGMLFIAAIVLMSFPAARGPSAAFGWTPLWLLGLPAASLLAARLLAWARRDLVPAPLQAPRMSVRRSRPAMAVARRRSGQRRGLRVLAAMVLR